MTHAGSHDNAPVLLTVAEAAEFLRTPVATLRYWRHLGIGPTGFRLGRRVVYSRADLISWLAQQRDPSTRRRADTELLVDIREIHDRSGGTTAHPGCTPPCVGAGGRCRASGSSV